MCSQPTHLIELVLPLAEQVADDPWKLLIAVTLLNKTSGKLAVPAFWDIMKKWPTPFDLSQGEGRQSYLSGF